MGYWKELTLISLAYLFCIANWLFYPGFDSPGTWFARSGAIMVLLAVITEFQLAERKHDVLSNSIGAAGFP